MYPISKTLVTAEQMPDELLQAQLARVRTAEYWLYRNENLDAGKIAKLA